MKLGLGLGLGSGNRLPRYVTDYFNGFELPGSTYSGGPTVVADNTGALVTSPADVLPIEGMRLSGSTWLPTTSLGAPIHPSTPLRTRKGTVSVYGEDFRGPLIEPARTNLFLNSTAPVTQNITTTAQAYTVTVLGTGDVTLSGTATGTATQVSPLTVTASAGTLTCTVTGTLTRVNVEAGAFGTSFIDTAATTVTRPAANLTRPTAGTALETGNDFAIYGRVVPKATPLALTIFALCSCTTADDSDLAEVIIYNAVRFRKRKNTETLYEVSSGIAPAADVTFEYIAYQHSASGMGISVRQYTGGTWGAWSNWATRTDANGMASFAPAATYQIGARNNAAHFAANYPFTKIIALNPALNPQTQIADLLAKGRI